MWAFFSYLLPTVKSQLDIYTLIGFGCKHNAFYADVISKSSEYAQPFYEQYLSCNYKDYEKDPDSVRIRGLKNLDLPPYAVINLIYSYFNNGDIGTLQKKVGGRSFLSEANKRYGGVKYFSRTYEKVENFLTNPPEWKIVLDMNYNVDDMWSDPRVKSSITDTDFDITQILGLKRAQVFNTYRDPADGKIYNVTEIEEINSIQFIENKNIFSKGSNPKEGDVFFAPGSILKLKFHGWMGKVVFFEIELADENFFG